ncbi:MAG: hypothetical protein RIT43_1107 [Bacteroidota bacterium]|jgi:hypothetical protein
MKKIIFPTLIATSLIFLSFVIDKNVNEKSASYSRTCEYSYYVKCDGSNQFVEVIRAKDASTAKAMCVNRYPNCKVSTKDANGKNCQ